MSNTKYDLFFVLLQPSRELAEQTYKELNNFKKYLNGPDIETMLAAGGIPIRDQLNQLQKGVRCNEPTGYIAVVLILDVNLRLILSLERLAVWKS